MQLLHHQVCREQWLLGSQLHWSSDQIETHAQGTVQAFATQLTHLKALRSTDITAAYRGDPAARHLDKVLFCYPLPVMLPRGNGNHLPPHCPCPVSVGIAPVVADYQ